MTNETTRRTFLQTSSAAAGAALAAGVASRAYAGESNELKIALIGCGGRGTDAAVQALTTSGPIKLTAMADVFEDQLKLSLRSISNARPQSVDVPAERQFVGHDAYRKAIDSGVDGVLLTTPPGYRPEHFEYAVKQGKHVFMEKPVATDAAGVQRVLEANKIAKSKNLKVVVGLQRHYDIQYQETIKRVHGGEIGDILYFRCYWDSGPLWVKPRQPGQSEMDYQNRNWYYFTWLSGDHIVEQHIHNVDVCNWVMGRYPKLAQSHAGRQVRTGKEFGEIYDHHAVEFGYEEKWDVPGVRMFSFCRQIAGTFGSVSEHVYGTKGYAHLNGFTLYDPSGERTWRYDHRRDNTLPKPGNPYQVEHDALWEAVRTNQSLNDGDNGAYSTLTAILGRAAGYSGKLVTWDQVLGSPNVLVPPQVTAATPPPVMPLPEGGYPIPMPGTWDKI